MTPACCPSSTNRFMAECRTSRRPGSNPAPDGGAVGSCARVETVKIRLRNRASAFMDGPPDYPIGPTLQGFSERGAAKDGGRDGQRDLARNPGDGLRRAWLGTLMPHHPRMNPRHVTHVTVPLEQSRRRDDVLARHLLVARHIKIKPEIQVRIKQPFVQLVRRWLTRRRRLQDVLRRPFA